MNTNTIKIGKYGESKASEYLNKIGYIFVTKNFYTNNGEIDLIFLQRDILVFIEVKTRRNPFFTTGREAVNKSKQKKIRKVASEFIAKTEINFREIRFDIIEYYTDNNKIEHFVDAF